MFSLPTLVLAVSLLASSVPQETGEVVGPAPALVQGRLLLPEGDPARGATLRLVSTPVATLERADDLPWQEMSTDSDAEGAFSFRLRPRPGDRYELHCELDGYASETWRWTSMRPGGVIDTGEVQLYRSGELRGRVVDAHGTPIPSYWQVLVIPAPPRSTRKQSGVLMRPIGHQARLEADGTDGTFHFMGLPEGPCRVRLHLEADGWSDGPEVDVLAGETAEVVLPYDGPELDRRIHVQLAVRPLTSAWPDPDSIVLRNEDGEWSRPTISENVHRGLDFDRLAPGLYSLEIDDPRFEPVQVHSLRPGKGATRVFMTGSSAVRLIVLDAREDLLIDRYDVRLRLDRSLFPPLSDPWRFVFPSGNVSRPATVRLHGRAESPLPRGLLTGLTAGSSTLIVSAPGYAAHYETLDLEPGELFPLEITLGQGGSVAGRVVDALGEPLGRGVHVTIYPEGEEDLPPIDRYFPDEVIPDTMRGRGYERGQVRTDPAGGFVIGDLMPGRYVVRARSPQGPVGKVAEVRVEEGRRTTVEIRVD